MCGAHSGCFLPTRGWTASGGLSSVQEQLRLRLRVPHPEPEQQKSSTAGMFLRGFINPQRSRGGYEALESLFQGLG